MIRGGGGGGGGGGVNGVVSTVLISGGGIYEGGSYVGICVGTVGGGSGTYNGGTGAVNVGGGGNTGANVCGGVGGSLYSGATMMTLDVKRIGNVMRDTPSGYLFICTTSKLTCTSLLLLRSSKNERGDGTMPSTSAISIHTSY